MKFQETTRSDRFFDPDTTKYWISEDGKYLIRLFTKFMGVVQPPKYQLLYCSFGVWKLINVTRSLKVAQKNAISHSKNEVMEVEKKPRKKKLKKSEIKLGNKRTR